MVHNILGSVDILGVLRFIYEDWRRGRGRRVEGVSLMDRQHCFPMPKMEGFFFHIFVFCD